MKKRALSTIKVFTAAFLASLIILSITSPVFGAVETEITELPSGLPVTDLPAAIEDFMAANQDTTAAASIAVFTDSEILYQNAFGFVDIENQLANSKDAVFEWGSCTKLLTWTCLMQLAEEGKVSLTEDIRNYLPKDFFKKLQYDEPITILNLMNHNAGWQETMTDLFVADVDSILSLEETLRLIEPDQVSEPGSVVAYSNWGTGLAGLIIERFSGQTYSEYVKKHIFEPLGMAHTAVAADLKDNEWVRETRMTEKAYTADKAPLGTCFYSLPLAPVGMATGTLDDFILFAKAFLVPEGEDCPLFKNRATLDEMLSPSLYFADGKTPRNCHGFWTDELAVPVIWHNGGTMGFSSWFALDPVSKTAMIVLCNQTGASTIMNGMLSLVFGKATPETGIPAGDLSGLYMNSRSVFSGYAKFMHIPSYVQIVKKAEGEFATAEGVMTISGTDQGYFIVNKDAPKTYLAFVTTDSDGRKIIQISSMDYVEQRKATFIFENVLIILFVLSVLFAIASLIVSGFRVLLRKKGIGTAGRVRALVNLGTLITLGSVGFILMLFMGNTARWTEIQPVLFLNAILALIPVAFAVYLIVTRKAHREIGRFPKVWLVLTLIFSSFVTVNLLYLELVRFL